MASGQITEKKLPLEIHGGIPVKFQRLDGTVIEGVLTMSPNGEWEILSPNDPDFMLNWAQRRLVGSNLTSSAFPTKKLDLTAVRVSAITLTETRVTPTG